MMLKEGGGARPARSLKGGRAYFRSLHTPLHAKTCELSNDARAPNEATGQRKNVLVPPFNREQLSDACVPERGEKQGA